MLLGGFAKKPAFVGLSLASAALAMRCVCVSLQRAHVQAVAKAAKAPPRRRGGGVSWYARGGSAAEDRGIMALKTGPSRQCRQTLADLHIDEERICRLSGCHDRLP